MGLQQHHGARSLVDLAALDAHEPVLHVIDTAHAMITSDVIQTLDKRDAVQSLAIQGDRDTVLEFDLDVLRLRRRVFGILGPQARLQPAARSTDLPKCRPR